MGKVNLFGFPPPPPPPWQAQSLGIRVFAPGRFQVTSPQTPRAQTCRGHVPLRYLGSAVRPVGRCAYGPRSSISSSGGSPCQSMKAQSAAYSAMAATKRILDWRSVMCASGPIVRDWGVAWLAGVSVPAVQEPPVVGVVPVACGCSRVQCGALGHRCLLSLVASNPDPRRPAP